MTKRIERLEEVSTRSLSPEDIEAEKSRIDHSRVFAARLTKAEGTMAASMEQNLAQTKLRRALKTARSGEGRVTELTVNAIGYTPFTYQGVYLTTDEGDRGTHATEDLIFFARPTTDGNAWKCLPHPDDPTRQFVCNAALYHARQPIERLGVAADLVTEGYAQSAMPLLDAAGQIISITTILERVYPADLPQIPQQPTF